MNKADKLTEHNNAMADSFYQMELEKSRELSKSEEIMNPMDYDEQSGEVNEGNNSNANQRRAQPARVVHTEEKPAPYCYFCWF